MTDEKQNAMPESIEIPHEINSVSDLSLILKRVGKPGESEEPCELKKSSNLEKPDDQKKEKTRFFRGHANESWKLLPSIYRETYLIKNEDKIIKDALTYCPDDFAPSDTLFEKLVKLQHYGYSTRLLDLTTNALVALYFASLPYINPETKKEEPKDGELIILDIPDAEIKYGDSDTVAILSALSLQSVKFNYTKLLDSSTPIAISEVSRKILDELDSIVRRQSALEKLEKTNNNIREVLAYDPNTILSQISKDREIINEFNRKAHVISLLHDIQADKPNFRPAINPEDLKRILCVRAKLNNKRISRQQGCFLLFGIKDNKTEAAVIPDEWQRFASNSQKILVKAESKDAIMEELQSFGISKRTLFPELEAQATEIMNHYKPQKTK
jgi:hypothetical protein